MANLVKPIAGARNVRIAASCLVIGMFACSPNESVQMNFSETQLTHATQGHTIHNTQVFSKDGQWVVYDTRNDDTKIGSTGSIEMVHTHTGEVKLLYQTTNQTAARSEARRVGKRVASTCKTT